MKPSELQFSIHDPEVLEERADSLIICFGTIKCWEERECLPDYYLAGEIDDSLLPPGYNWLIGMEECCWIVFDKSREDVAKELTALGFIENQDQQHFLNACWR